MLQLFVGLVCLEEFGKLHLLVAYLFALMAFKSVQYAPVAVDDEQDEKALASRPATQKTRYGLLLLSIITSLGLGILLGSFDPLQLFTRTGTSHPPQITDCGRTSADAIARGCVMEPLIYGWMPPHCQYSEVTDAYSFNK